MILRSTRVLCFGFSAAATAAAFHPAPVRAALPTAIAASSQIDLCERQAPFGGGLPGCYWMGSSNLGPMPAQVYWHIDRFPDVSSAEAARSLYSRVTIALGGQVFLQTVTDNPGWAPEGGERLATIGPLNVPSGPDLSARFLEVSAPLSAVVGATEGPKALFVLGGSICIELPAGEQDLGTRTALTLPEAPLQIASRAGVDGRALILVIHPSSEAWLGKAPAWQPAGLCAH